MRTITIHAAKTHLSRLVEEAAAGDPFIIAKADRPVARVVPLDAPPPAARRRCGFLTAMGPLPDDLDARLRLGEGGPARAPDKEQEEQDREPGA